MGISLHPDDEQDPCVFRVDLSNLGIGTSRVVFTRGPGVGTTAVHLGFAPLSFDRRRPKRSKGTMRGSTDEDARAGC